MVGVVWLLSSSIIHNHGLVVYLYVHMLTPNFNVEMKIIFFLSSFVVVLFFSIFDFHIIFISFCFLFFVFLIQFVPGSHMSVIHTHTHKCRTNMKMKIKKKVGKKLKWNSGRFTWWLLHTKCFESQFDYRVCVYVQTNCIDDYDDKS